MNLKRELAIAIHTARMRRGLSASEVARRLGINRTTYSSYEEARSEPPFTVGLKLCSILGIIPADLTRAAVPSEP